MKTFYFMLIGYLFFCCGKSEIEKENPYYFISKINWTPYVIKDGTSAYATLKTPETYWIFGNDAATGKQMYVRVELSKGIGTFTMKGLTQASFLDADNTNYHTNSNSGSGDLPLMKKLQPP